MIIGSMEELRAIIPAPPPMAFAKIRPQLCDQGIAFIRRSPFLVLATVGEWGIEVTSKGGHAGFVEVIDERTILIPERPGNKFALSLGNILANPRVGIMLFRPNTDEVLRLSGKAELWDDKDICSRLAAGGKPALLVIRVEIERAAFHCARAARRAGLWNPDSWDKSTAISFGKIYAEALEQPDVKGTFDQLTEASNAKLY